MNKRRKSKKVIQFNNDAQLYFKIGMKYLRKNKSLTSVRFLRRAVESDSGNPEYNFSLAGVLAELSKLEESNKILMHIVKNINPEFSECYFGMGCNYFDLGDFSKARQNFKRYLDEEPDGEFTDETKNILYYLDSFENTGK